MNQAFGQRGVSPDLFSTIATYIVTLTIIIAIAYFAVAIMIARARWDDWMAMFVSLFAFFFCLWVILLTALSRAFRS